MPRATKTTLCGVADLLARLLDGRDSGRRSRPEVYGHISDEGVGLLLKLSYFASQAVEDRRQPMRDARAGLALGKEVMYQTGTRHLSAYQVCQACEGVTCFVVTQDGQVTLFWSDAGTVHRWAPYWPWAKRSDHF
jgi:hypothetical protein